MSASNGTAGTSSFPGDERGTILVGVLSLLLMLSAFLLISAHNVVMDVDSASQFRARQQALYVAEAGLHYGWRKIASDSAWAGLGTPRNCQEGSFTVAVSRLTEAGAALPANQKRLVSTGVVGSNSAVTTLLVQW